MIDIGLRIKEIRNRNNLTQTDFCNIIDVKQANLSHIENNGKKISLEIILKIISNFNINIEWLLTGKGEMLKSEKPKIESKIKNSWVGNTVVGEGNEMNLQERGVDYGRENVKMLKQEIDYLKEQNKLLKDMIELMKKK